METQATRTSPLIWIAGIAIILFCATGIAAFMGWIPTSLGRTAESEDKSLTSAAKPAAAKARAAPASRPAAVAVARTTPAKVLCAECGVIESIRQVNIKGEGSGLGAVGGALVGGMLGNQVGDGRGQQLATVVGAVGGVVAGNEIEKRVKASQRYEVTVRLDNGASRMVSQASAPSWQAGDRVKLVDGVIRAN